LFDELGALLGLAPDAIGASEGEQRMSTMQTLATAAGDGGAVTVRLDSQTRAQLAALAVKDRRPMAAMARLILIDALKDRAALTNGGEPCR
jgi:hypothetical protein